MDFDFRAFIKKLWLGLRSGWWGLLPVLAVVFSAAYIFFWEFAEPLGIPDLINETRALADFLSPYGCFHLFFVVLISFFTVLVLELFFRKLTWASYGMKYQVHTQGTGWNNPWVLDGSIAGEPHSGKRIEAIRIKLGSDFPPRMGVTYRVHVEKQGWTEWRCNGQDAGTTGLSRRMEAIKVNLSNAPSGYSVIYQAFVQGDKDWQGWISDGKQAGTCGQSKCIEAIRIFVISPHRYGQFWRIGDKNKGA